MKLIEQQLALYEEEYKKFMGTNQFPKYELQFNEVSLNVADNYGFNSVAFAAYQTQTNKHTLVVSTNLKLSKHVIFHEFTHLYVSYRRFLRDYIFCCRRGLAHNYQNVYIYCLSYKDSVRREI